MKCRGLGDLSMTNKTKQNKTINKIVFLKNYIKNKIKQKALQ
jgi:hypothetical protein